MADKEVKAWFTANGKHIPIFVDDNEFSEKKKNREMEQAKEQAEIAKLQNDKTTKVTPQHIRGVLKKLGYGTPTQKTYATKMQGNVATEHASTKVGVFVEKVIGGGVQIYSNKYGDGAISDIKHIAEELINMGYDITYTPHTIKIWVNSKEI